jgi:hypothetical protein
MQRPLRSQSPKRVGSGPEGPPISSGGLALGTPESAPEAAPAGTAGVLEKGSEGGTETAGEEFFSELICIFYKCARIQLPRP